MSIYDLLFIFAFLSGLATLAVAAYHAVRGRFSRSGSILMRLAVSAALYIGVVALVSVSSPRREMKVGQERCFDDWCFAVGKVSRTPSADRLLYNVEIRLFSRAKGRPQRANDVVVYVVDRTGNRFEAMADPSAPPFNVLLGPGEAVTTTRVFALPADVHDAGLVLEHGGSGPGLLIIGDDLSLLHKRTVVRLEG